MIPAVQPLTPRPAPPPRPAGGTAERGAGAGPAAPAPGSPGPTPGGRRRWRRDRRPGDEQAAVRVVERLDRGDRRPHQAGHLVGRGVDGHPRPVAVGRHGHAVGHQSGSIGGIVQNEGVPGGHRPVDAIHAERPPPVRPHVPGHQVPTPPGVHQAVGLDGPLAAAALPVLVAEAESLGAAARPGDRDQGLRVDAPALPHQRDGRRRHGLDLGTQAGGEDPLHLAERPGRRLRHAVDGRAGRRGPQAHGHGLGSSPGRWTA